MTNNNLLINGKYPHFFSICVLLDENLNKNQDKTNEANKNLMQNKQIEVAGIEKAKQVGDAIAMQIALMKKMKELGR